jgi:hypothetical protein
MRREVPAIAEGAVKRPKPVTVRRLTMSSYEFWTWGKDNDASNWFSIILTVMAVPGILYLYDKHKRQSVHKLNVSFSRSTTKIGVQTFSALNIQFENQTNQVVYLAGGQFRACSRRFKIPLPPTASGWYPLKFAWSKTKPDREQYPLEDYECILQTAGPKTNMAVTSIAVDKLNEAFFSYQPGLLRKWLWWPKYFRMRYTAMVGDKKYSIETIF